MDLEGTPGRWDLAWEARSELYYMLIHVHTISRHLGIASFDNAVTERNVVFQPDGLRVASSVRTMA